MQKEPVLNARTKKNRSKMHGKDFFMNFEYAEKMFYEYLNQYDIENGSIKLKVIHTFEVNQIISVRN